MKHNLLIKPRPSDYLHGVNSPIQFKAVSNGDWSNYLWFNENQRNLSFDSDGCACFGANKSVDMQMDLLLASRPDLLSKVTDMGFMDTGLDGKLHFHSSPRFTENLTGNGTNGNSIPECFDVIRGYGLIPWSMSPFTPTMTQAEYFTAPNAQQLAMGKAFLALMGGKNFCQYHWVIQDAPKNTALMQSVILQSPLNLGVAVDDAGWNQVTPVDPPATQQVQHVVTTYKMESPSTDVSDNYNPYRKVLDAEYPIPYVLQAVVTLPIAVPTPIPIPPPVIAPTEQNVTILEAIVSIYNEILNLLKGRQLGSITPMSKFLSLNVQDFIKGIIVAIFTPCIIYVGQILQAATTGGTFSIDWGMLLKIGVGAGIAYLTKNYLTNSSGVPLSSEL